jgi:hypothetical protein
VQGSVALRGNHAIRDHEVDWRRRADVNHSPGRWIAGARSLQSAVVAGGSGLGSGQRSCNN